MALKLITTITFIIYLATCSARVISQSAISSVLQDIMSPANTEKAMQIINMAATKSNRKVPISDISRIVASNDCGLPARTILANEMPQRVYTRNEFALPGRIIANEQRIFGPDIVYPAQQSVRQIVREAPSNLMESLVLPKEIYQTLPIALPQESAAYPYPPQAAPVPYVAGASPAPYLPVGPPNPFLPVASPMSAMSTSCMPPPTQSRGQFLRKIPIPPPTL